MCSVRSRATGKTPSPGLRYRLMNPAVSNAVLGEKSADAFSNQRSRSSPTVPDAEATSLPSAAATMAARARWASRLPPFTVLEVQRFSPVRGSRPK
jgi:hypothetical protein